jgi:hypothetical protein
MNFIWKKKQYLSAYRSPFLLTILLVLGLFFGFGLKATNATIIEDDVLLYYPMDESSGNYLYEYKNPADEDFRLTKSENGGYTATTGAEGAFGYGIYSGNNAADSGNGACFYTASGNFDIKDYFTNDGEGNAEGEYSYSYWLRSNKTTGDFMGVSYSLKQDVLGSGSPRPNDNYYFVYLDKFISWKANLCSSVDINDDEWHHVLVQGTWGSSDMDLWIDGTEVCSNFAVSTNEPALGSGHLDWLQVMGVNGGGGYCQYAMPGYLDEFAMFNRKLTETEIGTLQTSSLENLISGPPECTSYTYTDWGACDGYYQVRNWATKTPSDCEGGIEPDLWRTCSISGDIRPINTIKPIYYISTTATNLIKYTYDTNRVETGDYINVYKIYIGQTEISPPTFIASSTIEDLNSILKINGNSYFTLTGTSTDYVDSQFTYYDVIPVLGGETYASTTFPIYWVDDNEYFFEEDYTLTIGGQSTGTSTPPDVSTVLFGTILKDYICTEDEWASTNWWTQTKCNALYWPVSIFAVIADGTVKVVQSEIFKMKNLFPLNIYLNIRTAWINSETELLATAFTAFTIIDESGNISVDLPSEWVASGTPAIQLWGPQIFEEHSSLAALFAGFRGLSTYIMWLAFIFTLWKLGEKALDEFFNDETETTITKIKV